MNDTPPCRDCAERRTGCHADCERYLEWRTRHIERKKARAETPGEKAAWDLLQSGARKFVKRRNK